MNRKFNSIYVMLIAAAVLAISACSKEGSEPMVSVEFKAFSDLLTNQGSAANESALIFTAGTIRLVEIEFEAETADGDSIEIEIERDVVVDFATGNTTPDLSDFTIPLGAYTELEVELELRDEDEEPSLVIEGTFTDASGESHPIRFEFNSGETFEVEKEGNIVVDMETSIVAEVVFDPNAWFSTVDHSLLEGATKNNEGVIVISETSNEEIFDLVADGLDRATALEIEGDDDDDDEDDD